MSRRAPTRPRTSSATERSAPTLRGLVAAQLQETTRRVARAVHIGRPSPIPLAAVPVPDTHATRAAEQILARSAPAPLINHSQRTYAFGALIGARDGLDWDAEVLYVAALLHDLGLTGATGGQIPFEQASAGAARSFALERSWSAARAGMLGDAIAQHLDVGTAGKMSPEIALLHFGAAADATGMRLCDIAPNTVAEVIDRYPREGFKTFFAPRMRAEARRHPRSATARLCRWGQLSWRINHAPFPE